MVTSHVTGDQSQFSHIQYSSTILPNYVANGNISPFIRTWVVYVSPSLTLNCVLYAPHFSVNLLFVTNLTMTLHCSVTFFSSYCEFVDPRIGAKVEGGSRMENVYYLDVSFLLVMTASTVLFATSVSPLQWHHCLGHFFLEKLKQFSLEPHVSKLPCEACELAKHRATFPPIVKKRSLASFNFVHYNIGSPSTV